MAKRFDPRPLDAEFLKNAFDAASPFRHVVIDDFFAEADALELHRAFPTFSPLEELKARVFAGRVYGPPPANGGSVFEPACKALAGPEFTKTLSTIAGIDRLAMDETHEGAGAHIGLRGSTLAIHADHNTHPKASWLYRRLNVLIYLNPQWDASWHASLLLYDRTGTRQLREIEPRFNRAVIMDVHDEAFHGYHALGVPWGQSRQLLALYYYSPVPSPHQAAEPHGTILGNPADLPFAQRSTGRVQRTALHYLRKLTPAPKWSDAARRDSVKVHV